MVVVGIGGVMFFGVLECKDVIGLGVIDCDGILNVVICVVVLEVGDVFVV